MFPIEFLQRTVRRQPEGLAVDDGTVSLSYSQLVIQANALGAGFQQTTGSNRLKVGLCGFNTLPQLLSYFAIHAAGGVMIPLNPRNSKQDIERQIELTAPDIIVVDENCLHLLADVHGPKIVVGSGTSLGEVFSTQGLIESHSGNAPQWPAVAVEDINAIKFTGGSSGAPKGVMQTFRVLNAVALSILMTYQFTSSENFLCAAPLTHGSGSFLFPTLYRGGRITLLAQPTGLGMFDALAHGGATSTWLPPTVAYAIMDAAAGQAPEFRHLNMVIYGGAAMPEDKLRRMRELFNGCIGTDYGQTEVSTIVTGMGPDEMAFDENLLSAGRTTPLTGTAIIDDRGNHLPPDEMGEIIVSGDLLMKGYYKMPEETAKTIKDGWLYTGDIGYFDERGYLFIKDRLRDVVISGGFNVYPSDVENGLCEHPDIYECVVFGIADAKWGERVEAAVQLRDGASTPPTAIIEFAKTRLGSTKAPKAVHILADLPRSPVGKVQRREVKAMFEQREVDE